MTTTNTTRTYVTTTSGRGDSEVGPHKLTYRETVDFDAREVRCQVVGYSDGGNIDQRSVRPFGPDFAGTPESVERARLASGWAVSR